MPLLHRAAHLISAAGHPLITISIFILFITFNLYPAAQASFISLLVIGGVALPIAVSNYLKTKRGHYTNFDVSDRKQREGFYPFLIGLLSLVTAILFLTDQPLSFSSGSAVFLLMIVVSWFINRKIKCSMHTSISLFLAFAILLFSTAGGVLMLVFAVMISASRLVLSRHTLTEVLTGGLVGFIFGSCNYILQSFVLN